MKVLDRLKLELNNNEYFNDLEYSQYLTENKLNPDDDYLKETMQRNLLLTVLSVLETLSNDTDLFRTVKTEFLTTGDAAKYLEQRIQKLKEKIATLPVGEDEEEYSSFSLMFTRGGRR